MNGWLRAVLLGWLVASAVPATAQPAGQPDAGIEALLEAVGKVAAAGEPARYLELLTPDADRSAATRFAEENIGSRLDRAVVRERDRQPLPSAGAGEGFRLVVAALLQAGNRGRLATWQLDVRRSDGGGRATPPRRWLIAAQKRLSSLDNVYRLALDTGRQFAAHDLTMTAEDFELRLPRGSVFVANAGAGPTALVMIGKGEMVFTPRPESERAQVKIFSGSPALRTRFDSCLIRLNPSDVARHIGKGLSEGPVVPADLERAQALFAAAAPHSYTLDVGNLDTATWSILPAPGDLLAEIVTRRFGPLTYAYTADEPEDVTLFDRARRRTIALYPSAQKLASRGRFFDEDQNADYAVTHYDIEASFAPDREWIEGRTRIQLRVRAASLTTLRVRIADALVVRSVVAEPFGRVMAVRVRGQDTLLVTLPSTVTRDSELALTVAYAGRVPSVVTASRAADAARAQTPGAPLEPNFFYTVPIAWYPQRPTTGYATATLRLTVPQPYTCLASGRLTSTASVVASDPAAPPATSFTFEAERPVPYLAWLVTRLVPVGGQDTERTSPHPVGTSGSNQPSTPSPMRLQVAANPGQRGQAEQVGRQAHDIVRFYTSLVGEPAYPGLTLALLDATVPSGNSPAYLAILNQQVVTSSLVWRDDPAGFADFPEFFTAHEIAHQWWGQAVGWKSYHEQWLSEALAQYFAALYAEHAHGHDVFMEMMERMQGWAMRSSDEGPIYLGGRVGLLRNDGGRAFRAVVYDKGAVVLHMLRRMVGDHAFFRGLTRFYTTCRFKKAGSEDLRAALEAASGVNLQRFFERWVYQAALPRLKFSWRAEQTPSGQQVLLRFEQDANVFDFPVTVTIEDVEGHRQDVVVPVTDRIVERRVGVAARPRNVAANRDRLAPVDISAK